MTPSSHPDLLVGHDTGDDAAVWRLDASRALVLTADFITPVVDDARAWGRIAAANAASDVYAMGGRPLLALNLVAWNSEELSHDLLVEVLQGAAETAAEGGWVVAGGHTVDDPEPKFGQAMVGQVDPSRILVNTALRTGDVLVLTKALGTGIVSTAVKQGLAPPDAVRVAVASMTRLNAEASEVALVAGATGATDVTGFGLLGHLAKMAEASGVDIELDASCVPLLPGVAAMAADGIVPGGTNRNLTWARDRLDLSSQTDEASLVLLSDAQTSGGLLFGATRERAEVAVEQLLTKGHSAAVVGRVVDPGHGRISVLGRIA